MKSAVKHIDVLFIDPFYLRFILTLR